MGKIYWNGGVFLIMSTLPTSISTFSEVPNRSNIAVFDQQKYQFLSDLTTITSELNTQAGVANSNKNYGTDFPNSPHFLITKNQYYNIAENSSGTGESYTLPLDTDYTQPIDSFKPFSSIILISDFVSGYPIEAIVDTITSTDISIHTTGGAGFSISGTTRIIVVSGGSNSLTSYKPTSSSSFGLQGQATFDSNYLYFCMSDNNWKRIALNSY
jgi:hypothetical protein